MGRNTDTLASESRGHPARALLRRNGLSCVTLLLPFVALACDVRWELAVTAACVGVLLAPGLLLTRWLFPTGHPLAEFPAGFGTAMTMSLLFFALPSVFALKLHWRMPTFLVVFVVVYAAACAALVALLARRRGPQRTSQYEADPFQFPLGMSRVTGLVLLLAATLTGLGVVLGNKTDAHDWWPWTLVGFGGGVLALMAVGVDRLRARARPSVPTPLKCGEQSERRRSSPSAVEATDKPHILDQWLTGLLWLGIAALTVYMMKSAYARPRYDPDDVTYVSQAVDYLSGAPMDRYEPSLGLEIPVAPGFVIGTVPLLAASISWATGIPPAALLHTLLLPLFVLAGVCSFAGLLSVLLRQHRLLVALALAVLLLVLLKTSDGHRSTVHFLIYRVAQPKSVHLMVILPVQLALLLLTVSQPSRGHTIAAVFAAIVGHLVHPFSTAAGGLWSGVLVVYALAARRTAFWSILVVAATFAACGGLHQLDAKYDFFGVGESPVVPRQVPIELARDEAGTVQTRLDAARTIGSYSLFRIGLLSIPWVLLIGWRNRAGLLVGLLSLAITALCFVEPLTSLLSKFMGISLLWRLRWIVPSAVNAALLAVCVYWAATVLLRRHKDRPAGPLASFAGVVITVGAAIGMMAATSSRWVGPPGSVGDLTKFSVISHAVAKELGGSDATSFVLVPEPARCPISRELCQLVPNVRVMLSRKHVIRWYFGEEELQFRLRLMRRFYLGFMSANEFRELLGLFPFDCAIVDYSQGRGERQTDLLSSLGWRAGKRFGRYEIWWAPGENDK